jgi:hypothetical protein
MHALAVIARMTAMAKYVIMGKILNTALSSINGEPPHISDGIDPLRPSRPDPIHLYLSCSDKCECFATLQPTQYRRDRGLERRDARARKKMQLSAVPTNTNRQTDWQTHRPREQQFYVSFRSASEHFYLWSS